MASLTRQISKCCPLLKKNSIVNSGKQLRKQAVKTWTLPLQQSGLPLFCPYRYSCQLVLKNSKTVLFDNHVRFCSSSTELNRSPDNNSSLVNRPETEIIPSSYTEALHEEGLEDALPSSPFEEVSEDEALQIRAEPPLPFESFSLQDYVDHSETLQKLVLLGVDLSKVEKRSVAGQLLLKLDFEKDIKNIILFLKDVGLEDEQLGPFLTKNPYIFREELEDLKTRVAYLTSKKFSKEAVAQMVSGAPYLLLFSVERLDNRLGFFQKELGLNAQKTRDVVTRLPRLLTGSLEPIKENLNDLKTRSRHLQKNHYFLSSPTLSASKGKTSYTPYNLKFGHQRFLGIGSTVATHSIQLHIPPHSHETSAVSKEAKSRQ